MKEVWKKQYDKKEPPWNYNKFDNDLLHFFRIRLFDNKKYSVIDLGCGNGAQAHYIENQFGNERNIFNVTATDIVDVLEYEVKNFIIDDALDS